MNASWWWGIWKNSLTFLHCCSCTIDLRRLSSNQYNELYTIQNGKKETKSIKSIPHSVPHLCTFHAPKGDKHCLALEGNVSFMMALSNGRALLIATLSVESDNTVYPSPWRTMGGWVDTGGREEDEQDIIICRHGHVCGYHLTDIVGAPVNRTLLDEIWHD